MNTVVLCHILYLHIVREFYNFRFLYASGMSLCILEPYCTYNSGGAVVEALRYKPEGRGIDSRWCHWNFSLTQSFWPHYGPGVNSASNRNEYQEYLLGVKAAGA
jgi:hypothetical protein